MKAMTNLARFRKKNFPLFLGILAGFIVGVLQHVQLLVALLTSNGSRRPFARRSVVIPPTKTNVSINTIETNETNETNETKEDEGLNMEREDLDEVESDDNDEKVEVITNHKSWKQSSSIGFVRFGLKTLSPQQVREKLNMSGPSLLDLSSEKPRDDDILQQLAQFHPRFRDSSTPRPPQQTIETQQYQEDDPQQSGFFSANEIQRQQEQLARLKEQRRKQDANALLKTPLSKQASQSPLQQQAATDTVPQSISPTLTRDQERQNTTEILTMISNFSGIITHPSGLVFYANIESDRDLYLSNFVHIYPRIALLKMTANDAMMSGPWPVTDKPSSESFDRTQLTDMEFNTTILTLSYFMTRESDYATKAAENVRAWFLKEDSHVNPKLRSGDQSGDAKEGSVHEMKDVYFFLDVIRMLGKDGFLLPEELEGLRAWFRQYLGWLEGSEEGIREHASPTHKGLYYDIQVLSIATFLGDKSRIQLSLHSALDRLVRDINATTGEMIHETAAKDCEHSQIITLQGWSTLSRIAKYLVGFELWNFVPEMKGEPVTAASFFVANNFEGTKVEPSYEQVPISLLCRAAFFAIPHLRKRRVCAQSRKNEREDRHRWWPLIQDAKKFCWADSLVANDWLLEPSLAKFPQRVYEMPSLFHTNHGLAPYWNLGSPHSGWQ